MSGGAVFGDRGKAMFDCRDVGRHEFTVDFKRSHLPEVLAVEREAFNRPWSESDFKGYLQRPGTRGIVYCNRGQVAGYLLFDVPRKLKRSTLVMANLAVAAAHRRNGVGRMLIGKALNLFTTDQLAVAEAFVAETNVGAHKFFRAIGFFGWPAGQNIRFSLFFPEAGA